MVKDLTGWEIGDARSFTYSNHGQYSVKKRRREWKRLLIKRNRKKLIRLDDRLENIEYAKGD